MQSELNFSVNVVIRDNKTTKKCLRSSKAHKAVIYDDTYAWMFNNKEQTAFFVFKEKKLRKLFWKEESVD